MCSVLGVKNNPRWQPVPHQDVLVASSYFRTPCCYQQTITHASSSSSCPSDSATYFTLSPPLLDGSVSRVRTSSWVYACKQHTWKLSWLLFQNNFAGFAETHPLSRSQIFWKYIFFWIFFWKIFSNFQFEKIFQMLPFNILTLCQIPAGALTSV